MKQLLKSFLLFLFIFLQSLILYSSELSSVISMWNKEVVQNYCNFLPNIRTGQRPSNIGFPLLSNENIKNNYLENFKKLNIFEYDNVIKLLGASEEYFKNLYVKGGINQNSLIFDEKNEQKDFPQLAFYQQENEKVFSFGDNHGGFITMAHHMLSETNDDLTVKDPLKKYIILGDIIDRGPASLPSLLFFLILHLKSPTNFFLVRGNHEMWTTFFRYGLSDEVSALFPNQTQSDNIITKIDYLCRLLPVAIYGVKKDKIIDMYMHGCIDKDDSPQEITALLEKCEEKREIVVREYSSQENKNDNLLMWGDSVLDEQQSPYGTIASDRGGGSEVTKKDIHTFLEKIPYKIITINCAHQHASGYGYTVPYFLPNQFHFNYNVNETKILRHGLCPCCSSAQPNNNAAFPGFIGYSTIVHHDDGKVSVVRIANEGVQGEEGIKNFVENYMHHLKKHLKEEDIFDHKGKIDIFSYLFTSFSVLYKNKSIKDASDQELRAFLTHYADAKKQYVAFEFENGKTNRYIPDLEWKYLIDIDDFSIQYNLDDCCTDVPGKVLKDQTDEKKDDTGTSNKFKWIIGGCGALIVGYFVLKKMYSHFFSSDYWKNNKNFLSH